jgi:hypothetical protein
VLSRTEDHPLDSVFAKYYAASPEFSELIVAWDSQSSKETKISLTCVHVLIDSFKCSDIMGRQIPLPAQASSFEGKESGFLVLLVENQSSPCLVLRLLSTLAVISGSVARDCVLHFCPRLQVNAGVSVPEAQTNSPMVAPREVFKIVAVQAWI